MERENRLPTLKGKKGPLNTPKIPKKVHRGKRSKSVNRKTPRYIAMSNPSSKNKSLSLT